MENEQKLKKVKNIGIEIAKLRAVQAALIKKKEVYKQKLKNSEVAAGVKKKKWEEFNTEYGNLRLKIGQKWVKLLDEQIKIVGVPKTTKINEDVIEALYLSI